MPLFVSRMSSNLRAAFWKGNQNINIFFKKQLSGTNVSYKPSAQASIFLAYFLRVIQSGFHIIRKEWPSSSFLQISTI